MISQSQRILLEAIKSSLFDLEPNYPPNIDWEDVVFEAKAQTVMGIVDHLIPYHDETSDHVKAMYMRIMYEQNKLIKLFDIAQIPFVILKGCAASIYYPKPFLRTMGDIDILVPRNRFVESVELLETNGYIYDHGKKDDNRITDDIREIEYIKNGIVVELHQSFSSPGVEVDNILESAIYRREYFDLNGFRFPVLPSPENGLVLLGHINQHLKNNVLGLRQIIDWEMYVNSVADNECWSSQFVPLIKETGLITLATYVTDLCCRYLGLPKKVCFEVDFDKSLTDELLEVVLTDGNFGKRIYTDKTKDEKSLISASYSIKRDGFFGYFTRVGMLTSKFCENHPSFKILAFFYGLFRQSGMGISAFFKNKCVGKNMGEGKKLYKKQAKRHELYKSLGVRIGSSGSIKSSSKHKEKHI